MGDPGVAERAQVLHPGGCRVGEGEVACPAARPARCRRRWRSPARDSSEICAFAGGHRRRLAQRAPAGRGQRRVVQVDELAVRGVGGEGHRVRVGHRRGDHLLRRRLPRPHLVPVVLAGPGRGRRAPTRRRCGRRGASAPSSARRWASRTAAARTRAGGRRPDREASASGRANVGPRVASVARRVHVVEHAGDLHAGRGEQRALGVALGHQQLPAQRRRDLGQVAPGPGRSYGTPTGAGTSRAGPR